MCLFIKTRSFIGTPPPQLICSKNIQQAAIHPDLGEFSGLNFSLLSQTSELALTASLIFSIWMKHRYLILLLTPTETNQSLHKPAPYPVLPILKRNGTALFTWLLGEQWRYLGRFLKFWFSLGFTDLMWLIWDAILTLSFFVFCFFFRWGLRITLPDT